MKSYKSKHGAQIASGRIHGRTRVVRRDRFGRFSKRGRRWTISRLPRKRKFLPPVPPVSPEWHIKISYEGHKAIRGGKHDIMLDAIFRSKKVITAQEVQAHLQNLSSGLPLPQGMKIESVEWKHGAEARTIEGEPGDLGAFGALINTPNALEIRRKES